MSVTMHDSVNEDLGLGLAWPELLVRDPSRGFITQVEEYPEENGPEDVALVWRVEPITAEPQLSGLTVEEFMHYVPPIHTEHGISCGVKERVAPLEIDWDL